MTAAELRIGNWVILQQDDNGIQRYNHDVDAIDIAVAVDNPERFSPIPLSPELLEAMGFEGDFAPQVPEWHHPSGFWFFDSFGTDSYSIRLMNKIDVHLKHLHQLQNLFYSLTGEELS